MNNCTMNCVKIMFIQTYLFSPYWARHCISIRVLYCTGDGQHSTSKQLSDSGSSVVLSDVAVQSTLATFTTRWGHVQWTSCLDTLLHWTLHDIEPDWLSQASILHAQSWLLLYILYIKLLWRCNSEPWDCIVSDSSVLWCDRMTVSSVYLTKARATHTGMTWTSSDWWLENCANFLAGRCWVVNRSM